MTTAPLMTKDEEKMTDLDAMLAALHDIAGVCGHCGRRKCAGRKAHSVLPATISIDALLSAIRIAKESCKPEATA